MISRNTIRLSLGSVLSGLVLTACGGVSEPGLAPAEELGTQTSALCTNLYVDNLSILGVSSYNHEAAGSGQWQTSIGSNAVRMEYYVDGVLRNTTEYPGNTGTWNFSSSPVSCGPHEFEVMAYPMVIDSAGIRTTCYENPSSNMASFDQYCTPTASVDCYRIDEFEVQCTGTGNGGSYSYTPYWQTDRQYTPTGAHRYSGWSAGSWTMYFPCHEPPPRERYGLLHIQFHVVDSLGNTSNVTVSDSFRCG